MSLPPENVIINMKNMYICKMIAKRYEHFPRIFFNMLTVIPKTKIVFVKLAQNFNLFFIYIHIFFELKNSPK